MVMEDNIINIKKIGIIGAGTIGASWATFFITKGFSINLHDVSKGYLDKAYM